jgi:ABC-type multidrug transport system ATPase subunit/ABC-type multidrug transport system permease subunit
MELVEIKLNNENHNSNHLVWKNINMTIKGKKILNDISGYSISNRLTVIMGPSGSGKTSLLNVLAGRVVKSRNTDLSGFIYTNRNIRNFSNLKKLSVYITQEDVLYPFLTVRETIELATCFYLDKNNLEKNDIICNTINILGLNNCQNSIVKVLSGGEKKRVSIGTEIVTNPSIILIDEPTSGIDSFQAITIIEILKNLSKDRIVITALHQPSSSVTSMFDDLILLSNGHCVYRGEFGKAVSYFENLGIRSNIYYNPVDYLLDIISIDYRNKEEEIKRREIIDNLIKEWKEYQDYIKIDEIPINSLEYEQINHSLNVLNLFIRAFKQNYRNKLSIKIKVFTNIVLGIILGLIYSNKAHSTNIVQDKLGVLFYIAINQAFSGSASILSIFPNEKKILIKELNSNAYKLSIYYITKLLAELPFILISPIIFGIINYWTVGLYPNVFHFYLFICLLILESIASMGLGLIVSSFSSTVEIATASAPSVLIIFFLFAGLFINIKDLPRGTRWFTNVSYIKWAFEGLTINEFKNRTFKCNLDNVMCISNGNDVLKIYGFENGSVFKSLGILSIISITYCVFAGFILWSNRSKYIKL